MGAPSRRLRLFLDTGVIVSACRDPESAAHGVVILTTQTPNYVVVRSEAVEREVRNIIARKVRGIDASTATMMLRFLETWRHHPWAEWWATPTDEELAEHMGWVLPVLKHKNDLSLVVTAIRAQPDWVISSNVEDWTQDLAVATGLRIITPWAFLAGLQM